MDRFVIRLIACLLLMAGMSGLPGGMGASCHDESRPLAGRHDFAGCISQHEGWLHRLAVERQQLHKAAVLPPMTSYRVSSSRPVRLLPTHGGKPTHHAGRWTRGLLSNPVKSISQQPRRHPWPRAVGRSPRRYYVITLRRLLC